MYDGRRPLHDPLEPVDAPDLIRIESLAHGGDGVGRTADGRTVFVHGSCPGDTLAVRVLADKGRYLLAGIQELVEGSADRVEAPCPHFGECGGCQWQHIAYDTQLRAKERIVSDALAHVGRMPEAPVLRAVRSPSEYGYRNKVEIAVDETRAPAAVGLFARGEDRVVPIDECLLLPERARAAPRAVAGALRFLARGGPTGVERASLRVAANTRDVELALWSRPRGFPRQAAAKVLRDATSADGVVRVLFKGAAKERSVVRVEVLSGRGWWRERVGPTSFAVSAPSFFQVNTAAAEELTRVVLEAASPDGSDRVLDLYAGVGTFTIPLARTAGEVVAVEQSGSALRDLRRNLEENGVAAEIEPGDAARAMGGLGVFDVVVADPPRGGMEAEVLSAIDAASPRRIVYVSCDPATLARDVSRLAADGWGLVSVAPVDLFPQTSHVESVAVLERA